MLLNFFFTLLSAAAASKSQLYGCFNKSSLDPLAFRFVCCTFFRSIFFSSHNYTRPEVSSGLAGVSSLLCFHDNSQQQQTNVMTKSGNSATSKRSQRQRRRLVCLRKVIALSSRAQSGERWWVNFYDFWPARDLLTEWLKQSSLCHPLKSFDMIQPSHYMKFGIVQLERKETTSRLASQTNFMTHARCFFM